MNIALCTDENFSVPALVCITSIFENNKGDECHIYILTDGLSDKTIDKFQKLGDIYKQQISVMFINKHRFAGLTVSERYPVSMYYRFLLPEMLPEEDKVLYLDCDIIVRHSLKAVYDTSLNDVALGAVVSQSCDWIKWTNDHKLTTPFFNSGVLLMNLDYWRKNNTIEALVKWVANYDKELWLPDQSALNKVLEGKVVYLNYTYNFQERWTRNLEGSNIHFSKWDEIMRIAEDPIVVHYCDAEKPWFVESKHRNKSDFLYYAQLYPFIGFKPQKRYSVVYKLTLIIDKIVQKIHYWAESIRKHEIKKIIVSR